MNLIRVMPAEGKMPITVTINNQSHTFSDSLPIQKLLEELKLTQRSLAIAINQEIIPRSEFEKRWIQDRDIVEMIQAVGGG